MKRVWEIDDKTTKHLEKVWFNHRTESESN